MIRSILPVLAPRPIRAILALLVMATQAAHLRRPLGELPLSGTIPHRVLVTTTLVTGGYEQSTLGAQPPTWTISDVHAHLPSLAADLRHLSIKYRAFLICASSRGISTPSSLI